MHSITEEDLYTCQQCGYCCQGETTVSLDENDVRRLTEYLGMSFEQAREKYLRVTGNVIQMKIKDGHCIFFDNGCTVHPGKPWRCSQWPLHPSILHDRNNFEAIRKSCPGIPDDSSFEEFCEKLDRLLEKTA